MRNKLMNTTIFTAVAFAVALGSASATAANASGAPKAVTAQEKTVASDPPVPMQGMKDPKKKRASADKDKMDGMGKGMMDDKMPMEDKCKMDAMGKGMMEDEMPMKDECKRDEKDKGMMDDNMPMKGKDDMGMGMMEDEMPMEGKDDMKGMDKGMMGDMRQMEDKGDMGGMGMKKMDAGVPSSPSMHDSMAPAMGADMMGRMRGSMQGQRNTARPSSMPGFPGASHLYHIGATGFFLDHPKHIALSTAQKTALTRVKQKASADQADSDRKIEDAEQSLWALTAAEAPDADEIEAKVQAIGKLRSDQRVAFIRSVGEAGKTLTSDQRATLLGVKPPAENKPQPAASKPAPMPAMPSPPAGE